MAEQVDPKDLGEEVSKEEQEEEDDDEDEFVFPKEKPDSTTNTPTLTLENLEALDKQHQKYEWRQFACAACQKNWWKEVPSKKPVSRCQRCNKKYDALPREKEFGIGHHECECGHTFRGFTRHGVTSPCYKCQEDVLPQYFLHDKSLIVNRTGRRHKCSQCNGSGECPNKQPLVNVSSPHVSTGSTASSVCSDTERSHPRVEDPHEADRRRAYNKIITEGISSLNFGDN